ncbi:MAG: DMT family transporter, partial [Phycisphaerales bacterium]|nr:DMT family transporter [Phycisphaerales bacterium]
MGEIIQKLSFDPRGSSPRTPPAPWRIARRRAARRLRRPACRSRRGRIGSGRHLALARGTHGRERALDADGRSVRRAGDPGRPPVVLRRGGRRDQGRRRALGRGAPRFGHGRPAVRRPRGSRRPRAQLGRRHAHLFAAHPARAGARARPRHGRAGDLRGRRRRAHDRLARGPLAGAPEVSAAAAGAPAPRRLSTASADALLLLAALIWGSTFVAQKLATAHMGPLRFTGVRFAAGALVLLPVAIWRWRRIAGARARRDSVLGGLLAGLAMAVASTTQQVGMHETSVSHAGFITSLYVIIVPFLGMLVGQRVGWNVWAGALLAVAGLFFLSLWNPGGSISMSRGDLWVLACAGAWSLHVQVIGWAARAADAFVG